MQTFVRSGLAIFILVFLLHGCKETPFKEDDGLPKLSQLGSGWNEIEPGGETVCSNGEDYSFFVRPGDSSKLLFYLQGGGACWSGETCDLLASPTYKPTVSADDAPGPFGIFDYNNSQNPFADFTTVFVPYCTGDVHVGNRIVEYDVAEKPGKPAHVTTINHAGFKNVSAILNWTYANLTPDSIFVTGSSAGAIPSPFYAAAIADEYQEAFVAQLGDAAGAYRSDAVETISATWGSDSIVPSGYDEFLSMGISNEEHYMGAALRHPDIQFSQFDTASDSTQAFFLSLAGVTGVDLIDLLEANHADIRNRVSNFKAFIAGGGEHTILGRPEFYEYQANGSSFRDWVHALKSGRAIADVKCAECTQVNS